METNGERDVAAGDPFHVAVVDDEPSLRETLSMALEREGCRVSCYKHGAEAWEAFSAALPDVAILDVTMPHMDGLELCARIRRVSETLPVIFLSSRDEEVDRVLGLEIGADDYVTKPFSLRELMVRVRLHRRRALALSGAYVPPPGNPYVHGAVSIDEDAYELRWRGAMVPLTITEFRICRCLFRAPGKVRTREQLIEAAYPERTFVESRTVDTHIKRIRRKFEAADPEFAAIEAVAGAGYKASP